MACRDTRVYEVSVKSNQCKEILRVVHETVEGILKDRKVRGVCRLSWLRPRAAAAFTSPAVAMKTDRNVRLITFGGMRASPSLPPSFSRALSQDASLSEVEILNLINQLKQSQGTSQLNTLKARLKDKFVTSGNVHDIVYTFTDQFDKMDALLFLQSHLMDQNKFPKVLQDVLESEEDRQNVWHRIYSGLN